MCFAIAYHSMVSWPPYVTSSVVHLLNWFLSTDLIRYKKIMSTIHIRKVNTVIGLWVPGAYAVLAIYAGCNADLALTLFARAAGLNNMSVCGCKSGIQSLYHLG